MITVLQVKKLRLGNLQKFTQLIDVRFELGKSDSKVHTCNFHSLQTHRRKESFKQNNYYTFSSMRRCEAANIEIKHRPSMLPLRPRHQSK